LRKEEDSDLALVQALQHGEDRTLNELMDRHREGLLRFVLRHVRNEIDALELTMETFVRAYFNIGKFRPKAKFATWLPDRIESLPRSPEKPSLPTFAPETGGRMRARIVVRN
jgi:hypothetical protein